MGKIVIWAVIIMILATVGFFLVVIHTECEHRKINEQQDKEVLKDKYNKGGK